MASVTIKRGTEAEVASTAITDGQILFTTDREYNNQIMADVGEERILIGGNNIFTGTQAEYEEALRQGLIFEGMQVNITDDYDRDLESQNIPYDNTDSGLSATNVKDAIDEVQSEMGNSYATTDTLDTTIASADKIPFYDESATAKKNITLDNFVDTIAPNFGSQISTSQGNMLDLLDKDGNLMDSVVIQTKANNVSYTDTYSIGETDMQGALDKTIEDVTSQSVASGISYTDTNNIGATNVQSAVDTLSDKSYGTATLNSTYVSQGSATFQKIGKVVTVFISDVRFSTQPPDGTSTTFATGLPRASSNMPATAVILLYPWAAAFTRVMRVALAPNSTALNFNYSAISVSTTTSYYATFSYICE